MSSDDWYRNTDWNKKIAGAFFIKLARARTQKAQYLRIQANYLTKKYPRIALELLEQYFVLDDTIDHSQAFCDKAAAHLSLEQTDMAVKAYESAIQAEQKFNGVQTGAYLQLCLLLIRQKITSRYPYGMEILRSHQERLFFPRDFFYWNACFAIFSLHVGQEDAAIEYAQAALDAAEIKKSGLRYHQSIGLVGTQDTALIKKVWRIAH